MSSSIGPYISSNNNNNVIFIPLPQQKKKQKQSATLEKFEGVLASIGKLDVKNLKLEEMTLENRVECLEKFKQ
ncbi:MAG: hypothetical protein HWD61_13100 [Parachlamydiaceae bacterium]|nr:MAG: hypothetical protein HWD61_13100 [Parachlamydiaceae bacterium]